MKKKLLKTILALALGGAAEYVVREQPGTLEEQGKVAAAGALVAGAAWWSKQPKKNLRGVAKVVGTIGGGAALAVLAAPSPNPQALIAAAVTGAIIGAVGLGVPGPRDVEEQANANSEVHGNPPVRQPNRPDSAD